MEIRTFPWFVLGFRGSCANGCVVPHQCKWVRHISNIINHVAERTSQVVRYSLSLTMLTFASDSRQRTVAFMLRQQLSKQLNKRASCLDHARINWRQFWNAANHSGRLLNFFIFPRSVVHRFTINVGMLICFWARKHLGRKTKRKKILFASMT
jgi:hypothetical protein